MQKILIIDDDRDMCLLLKRFLTRHGFEVLEAYNGKKALEILDETEPSLVMCDFRLEDMEGNVLLGKIKEKYPHLPVIIITGYSDIKIAVEVMKMGAYDYITKPLFPDEILVTIRKALETSASPQEQKTTSAVRGSHATCRFGRIWGIDGKLKPAAYRPNTCRISSRPRCSTSLNPVIKINGIY